MKILTIENDSELNKFLTERMPERVPEWYQKGLITTDEQIFYLDYGTVITNFRKKVNLDDESEIVELLKSYEVFKTFSVYSGDSLRQLKVFLTLMEGHKIIGKKHYEHTFYLSNALWELRFESIKMRQVVDWCINNNSFYEIRENKFVRISLENISG